MATNPLFKPKKPQDIEFEKSENSAALRVQKQNPQTDPNKVQWPTLQTLKTKPMRGIHGAHLPPELEPMLPGDDLGEFFKERAVVDQTRLMQVKTRKSQIWIFTLILSLVLILTYTFIKPARELTHSSMEKFLSLNNSQIKDIGFTQEKRTKSLNSIESQILLIRSGHWKEAEQKLADGCSSWVVNSQCIVKGYFLIYRGKFNQAKPMISFNPTEVAKLSLLERALWHLSQSVLEVDEFLKITQLKKALTLTNTNALKEVRKQIFDDFIVLAVKKSSFKSAAEAFKFAQQDHLLKADESLLAKWQVLSSINISKEWSQGVLSKLFKSGPNHLSSDSVSFAILAPAFIKGGKASLMAKMAESLSAKSAVSGLDPEYQKSILQSSIRIFWAQGRRSDVVERLGRYPNKDEFYKHFSAAAYSLLGSKESLSRGYEFLKENPLNRSWETLFLKGSLAAKLNRLKEASKSYNELLLNEKPASKVWATYLLSEIYLAQKKYKEAQKTLTALPSREQNQWQYLETLRRVYDGLGSENDSSKIRLKLDAIKSQPGYWSSNEMLTSPLGPLALTLMK